MSYRCPAEEPIDSLLLIIEKFRTCYTFRERCIDSGKTLVIRRALSQTLHTKEPPRCIFTIVKLVPKLFIRLNLGKYHVL